MNTTFAETNNTQSAKTVEAKTVEKKSTLIDNITEVMTIISMWAVTAVVIGLVSLTWV
tara:strand:- start:7361 stop:7534 length:174 start_codon:yes stop_codon:yes gene_type:complete